MRPKQIQGRSLRALIISAATVAVMMVGLTAANASVVTSMSGQTSASLVRTGGNATCASTNTGTYSGAMATFQPDGGVDRNIWSLLPTVYARDSVHETVQVWVRLDAWNGSTWVKGVRWLGPYNAQYRLGGSTLNYNPWWDFGGYAVDNNLSRGTYSVQFFLRWYWDGTRIADATIAPTVSDYSRHLDGYAPEATIGNTPSSTPGYCILN